MINVVCGEVFPGLVIIAWVIVVVIIIIIIVIVIK